MRTLKQIVAWAARPCSSVRSTAGDGRAARATCMPVVALLIALSFIAQPARSQIAIAREVVENAVEQIFKQASKQGVRELTEMGGRTAVQEVLEQSAREGGEQLVRKVTQYGIEEGPLALRAIGRSPGKIVEALDGMAPELRGAALQALERDPQALMPLVRQYGSSAMEVAARHPGVGEQVVAKLGGDGINLGRQLTTDQSIILARHADEIAHLAPAERAGVVRAIQRAPARVLDFLESHPKILLTTAGVATVVAMKDQLIGDGGVSKVLADGRVITTPGHPGLIERILPTSLKFLSTPLTILVSVIGAGVAGWFAIHLWSAWRIQRLRQAVIVTKAKI